MKARNIITPKVVISNEPILMRVGNMRGEDTFEFWILDSGFWILRTPSKIGNPKSRIKRSGTDLEAGLLIGDEAEDVDLAGGIEMLGHFEELDGEQRVQPFVEHRFALL